MFVATPGAVDARLGKNGGLLHRGNARRWLEPWRMTCQSQPAWRGPILTGRYEALLTLYGVYVLCRVEHRHRDRMGVLGGSCKVAAGGGVQQSGGLEGAPARPDLPAEVQQ